MNSPLENMDFIRYLRGKKKNSHLLDHYRFIMDQMDRIDQSINVLCPCYSKRKFTNQWSLQIKIQLKQTLPWLMLEERQILMMALKDLESNWLRPLWKAYLEQKKTGKPHPNSSTVSSSISSRTRVKRWPSLFSWLKSRFNNSKREQEQLDWKLANLGSSHALSQSTWTSFKKSPTADTDPQLFSKLLIEKLELLQKLRLQWQEKEDTKEERSQRG